MLIKVQLGAAPPVFWVWCDNHWSPTRWRAHQEVEMLLCEVVSQAETLLASNAEGSNGDAAAKNHLATGWWVSCRKMYRLMKLVIQQQRQLLHQAT